MKKLKKYIVKNKNLNIVISTISVIWIWRGTWSITDMFLIDSFEFNKFLAYLMPTVIGYWYLVWNDSKLTELLHSTETEEQK